MSTDLTLSNRTETWNKFIDEFDKELTDNVMVISNNLYTQFIRKKSAWELRVKTNKKSGSIDMSKLQTYLTSEDIFKRKVMMPKGKSHGVVVLVDNSGSMNNDIYNIMINVCALALFAKRAKIKFEAYIFTSTYKQHSEPNNPGNGVYLKNLRLTNIYNSSMSNEDIKNVFFEFCIYKKMLKNMSGKEILKIVYGVQEAAKLISNLSKWDAAGTPLVPAYLGAFERAAIMKESGIQHVSLFTLTDGDGDGPLQDKLSSPVSTFLNPFNQRLYMASEYAVYEHNNSSFAALNKCSESVNMINNIAEDMHIDTNHILLTNRLTESQYRNHRDELLTPFLKNKFVTANNILGYNKVSIVNYETNIGEVNWEATAKEVNENLKQVYNKKFIINLLSTNIIDSICRFYK